MSAKTNEPVDAQTNATQSSNDQPAAREKQEEHEKLRLESAKAYLNPVMNGGLSKDMAMTMAASAMIAPMGACPECSKPGPMLSKCEDCGLYFTRA